MTFHDVVSVSETKTDHVTMNWCVFGPVPEDEYFNTVHDVNSNLKVTVGAPVMMQGSMEVYAVARTSGHSLGLTSMFPACRG